MTVRSFTLLNIIQRQRNEKSSRTISAMVFGKIVFHFLSLIDGISSSTFITVCILCNEKRGLAESTLKLSHRHGHGCLKAAENISTPLHHKEKTGVLHQQIQNDHDIKVYGLRQQITQAVVGSILQYQF